VRFQRRIVWQATRGGGQPSIFGLQLSQAILQFAELFLLPRKLAILLGSLPPRFVALLFEVLALPHSPLQTPPQAPPHHPQGQLEL
jgi:hypothetical protein